MSCRALCTGDPGVLPAPPVSGDRLKGEPFNDLSGPYRVCRYCGQVHKDPHIQGMYPLHEAQLAATEMHVEPPSVVAGIPSFGFEEPPKTDQDTPVKHR